MADTPFTLYKLIVLYALRQAAYPLTNAQISNLFLDNDYTSYLRLQEVLSELVETDLIKNETRHGTSCYLLSPQGEETIRFFTGDISPEIRHEIRTYLQQHARELRNNAQISAEYEKTPMQDYSVHCRVEENGSALIDLQISVPTESAAQKALDNWKIHSQEIYESLTKQLLS